MLPQLAALTRPPALLATLDGMELQAGQIHSARASVLLVDMPLVQQLLVQVQRTALHVRLADTVKTEPQSHSARALVLLVVTRWRILLLVQVLKTALHAAVVST